MRSVMIAGGKLQGVEASYLAAEAGYRTLLIDRHPGTPASGLASAQRITDIFDEDAMLPLVGAVDAVLPALEDLDALEHLSRYGEKTGTPVICDLPAYRISSSKTASNRLFDELGIPHPAPFPECGFPVIVKPDGSSGSRGVSAAWSEGELADITSRMEGAVVVQHLAQGRSYSIEVVGNGRGHRCLPITEVCIAPDRDCMRIIAPARIDPMAERLFKKAADSLGRALMIDGIFDVEAIVEDGVPLVLEIDARLPSQTPIGIYHATGINMVAMLVEAACGQPIAGQPLEDHACLYQQVEMGPEGPRIIGEHPLSLCGPLRRLPGFFGANLALTDFEPGRTRWHAIVIIAAETHEAAWRRFELCLKNMQSHARRTGTEERTEDVATY